MRPLTAALALALLAPLPAAALSPVPIHCQSMSMDCRDAVKAAVSRWLDLNEGKVVHRISPELSATYHRPGSQAWHTNYLQTFDRGWRLSVGFTEEITPAMGPDEIRARIRYVAADGIALTGLSFEGWQITARTPSSHLPMEAVEVVGAAPGRLVLRLRPEFFSVHGIDRRANPPADAPMPPEAWVSDRRGFTGDLLVTFVY